MRCPDEGGNAFGPQLSSGDTNIRSIRCNHVWVTSGGSPDIRFRRALATGNPTIVLAAAAELSQLSLADALAVCLVLYGDRERYGRAAVRWHGRLCTEDAG